VAADSERTLSFWHLAKQHLAAELVMSPSACSRKPGFYYDCKPELQSAFNLAAVDPEGRFAAEQIMGISFVPELSHLLVSTNMRLLLLEVAFFNSGDERRGAGQQQLLEQEQRHGSSGRGGEERFGVLGYAELDKVSPGQQRGLFALNVIEPVSALNTNTSLHQQQLGKLQPSPAKRLSHKSLSSLERRVVHWRLTSEHGQGEKGYAMMQRSEWSNDRFNAALRSLRPIP
jgi:hypothetical protein